MRICLSIQSNSRCITRVTISIRRSFRQLTCIGYIIIIIRRSILMSRQCLFFFLNWDSNGIIVIQYSCFWLHWFIKSVSSWFCVWGHDLLSSHFRLPIQFLYFSLLDLRKEKLKLSTALIWRRSRFRYSILHVCSQGQSFVALMQAAVAIKF